MQLTEKESEQGNKIERQLKKTIYDELRKDEQERECKIINKENKKEIEYHYKEYKDIEHEKNLSGKDLTGIDFSMHPSE